VLCGIWLADNQGQYRFLTHAILALGAQHLAACYTNEHTGEYSLAALRHRVCAIAELNTALSTSAPPQVSMTADGDARFAAAIALTFQSTYMADDGMLEFFTMLRGWSLIQTNLIPVFSESMFGGFTERAYVDSMRSVLSHANLQSCKDTEDGRRRKEELCRHLVHLEASLRLLKPLCESESEHTTAIYMYLGLMEKIARLAKESPAAGQFSIPSPLLSSTPHLSLSHPFLTNLNLDIHFSPG